MTRPRAVATLLAAVAAAAPPRLVKKLDQGPRVADAWTWSAEGDALVVTTDGGETVRLAAPDGVVRSLEGGGCSCLLSPRCFHVLAVVAALALDDGPAEPAAIEPAASPMEAPRVAVTDAERTAAAMAWEAATRIVAGGASAAGAVVQGELLRASHAARTEGLHRLGAAAVRIVQAARALRAERPDFALADLCEDLDDLLATSWAVRHEAMLDDAWRGVARRAYENVGGLRLVGLFTEPIVAGGHAGVVTYVAADRGRVFTLNDVMPGEADRARSAYDAAARMGDTSIPHRALVREGLFMQDATASRDMRLGAGAKVKAVRAGPTTVEDPVVTALWSEPLATQIARAYAALDVRVADRAAAATLVFVRGTVFGREESALVLRVDDALVRVVAPSDHAELSYRDNLRLLASAPGLVMRLAGHVVHDRAATLAGIAILAEPTTDGPQLALPPEWAGRVCLGLDRLQGAHIVGATRAPIVAIEKATLDPLAPLRRRVQRIALGGRGTLGSAAVRGTEHERALFEKRHLPSASAVLAALVRAALERQEDLALAWLAASTYERTATRALRRSSW